MTTIDQRLDHLETTIISLHTIPEAIKGLGTRMERLEAKADALDSKVNAKVDQLAADVAWIREKLS